MIARARAESDERMQFWTVKWDEARGLWAMQGATENAPIAWFSDSREAWAMAELLNAERIERLV